MPQKFVVLLVLLLACVGIEGASTGPLKCSDAVTCDLGLTLKNSAGDKCDAVGDCRNCICGKKCASQVKTNYVLKSSPSVEWCDSTTGAAGCDNCFNPTCATWTCTSTIRLYHPTTECDSGTCSDSVCCEPCPRIHITVTGGGIGPSNYNVDGEYFMLGLDDNGKPQYEQPGNGNHNKPLFLYYVGTTWYLSETLGETNTVVNYMAKNTNLPLVNNGLNNDWHYPMKLECKGKDDAEGQCMRGNKNKDGPVNCKARGKGHFQKLLFTNAECNGDCGASCCDYCQGFQINGPQSLYSVGGPDFDFTGVFVVQDAEKNKKWLYTREDGLADLYFHAGEWCIESVANRAIRVCAESKVDGPKPDTFANFQLVCYNDLPIRSPENCDGHWRDVGKCTLPCKIDGDIGKQDQIFIVEAVAKWRGAACLAKDHTTRTIDCHDRPCPDDCIGRWITELDAAGHPKCSKLCGWGTTTLTYDVQKEATGHGHACPHREGKTITKPCFIKKCVSPATSSSATTVAAP